MTPRALLQVLFAVILLSLLVTTIHASLQQPVWEWTGLTQGIDRWWTRATLLDAYFGFITFFVWVCFKERSFVAKLLWFIAIMALGNMAMAGYVLLQLRKLAPGEPIANVLVRRPA